MFVLQMLLISAQTRFVQSFLSAYLVAVVHTLLYQMLCDSMQLNYWLERPMPVR